MFPSKSQTSDQHASVTSSRAFVPSDLETTHVSSARVYIFVASPSTVQFLLLNPSQSTAHNEKPHTVPDLLRNTGPRVVMQSSLPSATAWRQMTTIAPFAVKTSNLGAFKSIMGSIPRPYQNNPPFGSILSSFLADSGVCLDTCRSGYHGMHVLGA
jgi:hypothetical protein